MKDAHHRSFEEAAPKTLASPRESVSWHLTWQSALWASVPVIVFASASLGCESPRADDPSLDRLALPPRLTAAPPIVDVRTEISGATQLTLSVNQNKLVMNKAIAVGEGTSLHMIASESSLLSCDGDHYPKGAAWLELRYDSGPLGDFYADVPTPVTINFSHPADNTDWREAIPTWARAQITSLTSDKPSLKIDFKRNIGNPDPKIPTVTTGSGAIDLIVCQSALDLLATRHPAKVEAGDARATFGDVSFPIRSALAFVTDDAKNGASVTSMGLYEAESVSCDKAKRAISDHGGGIDGWQVMVGPPPLGVGKKAIGLPTPVTIDVSNVLTGESWFESQVFDTHKLLGFVQITASDLSEDPLPGAAPPIAPPPRASGVAGKIHAESSDSFISGTFKASICKR